jgi:hypothetical protein
VSPSSTLPLDEKFEIQEEHRRSKMKKFMTVVGFLAVIATPAFAQSYTPGFGTGNVINEPALEQQAGRADATSATSAFAQAPEENTHRKARVDSDNPAETGGGSVGYNEELKQY